MEHVNREAAVMSRLKHGNIVELLERIEDPKGRVVIVVEFAAGGDLDHLIHCKRGKLEEDVVMRFFGQLLDALAYMHELNPRVLHRDIKPSNIFLALPARTALLNQRVLLGDLGLAKQGLKASTMLGTLSYMAPGILCGRTYSAEVDLWALGCVLYEMATGTWMFESESATIEGKWSEERCPLYCSGFVRSLTVRYARGTSAASTLTEVKRQRRAPVARLARRRPQPLRRSPAPRSPVAAPRSPLAAPRSPQAAPRSPLAAPRSPPVPRCPPVAC
eukprot:TRINITY_DN5450_c0_g4_i2.p1 TRINITY_DN5450_c0_g4~~TRINITY_DN5450_c0_g4_i2.p1  ORF type:complete len:275 (+),score=44.51 TRINITY_DN5450_c0_g4_i2:698-1522(+)